MVGVVVVKGEMEKERQSEREEKKIWIRGE